MKRKRIMLLAMLLGCANATKSSTGDDAGSGSAMPTGRAGHGFVAGGVVAKSASYKLVGTLSSGQGASASAHYAQHGGVVGATQP